MTLYGTSDIAAQLGFVLQPKFIVETLGVVPVSKKLKAAYQWTPAEVATICKRIEERAKAARLKMVAQQKADEDDEL